jgi:hypothetical protein
LATSVRPAERALHIALLVQGNTGDEMMIWGGYNGSPVAGGHYLSNTNVWDDVEIANGPSARAGHTAVWLKDVSLAVIWGGFATYDSSFNSGAVLHPQTNLWLDTTPVVLAGRCLHTAVSTGERMVIWGGQSSMTSSPSFFNDGAIFTYKGSP